MNDPNQIVQQAEFTIIAVVIHKERLSRRYADTTNPYEMALTFCMERAHLHLGDFALPLG